MLELGQKVLVITDKGIAYDATVLARAKGEDGTTAYKVTLDDGGTEQLGQWHRASDLFVKEETWEEKKDSWDKFLKG